MFTSILFIVAKNYSNLGVLNVFFVKCIISGGIFHNVEKFMIYTVR
jgi:hypothetical protein